MNSDVELDGLSKTVNSTLVDGHSYQERLEIAFACVYVCVCARVCLCLSFALINGKQSTMCGRDHAHVKAHPLLKEPFGFARFSKHALGATGYSGAPPVSGA